MYNEIMQTSLPGAAGQNSSSSKSRREEKVIPLSGFPLVIFFLGGGVKQWRRVGQCKNIFHDHFLIGRCCC
jgi:hypothetical protein